MALIDRSYFIGELNIPGKDRTGISEVVDWFIAKYEPELLERLLGYDCYRAFKEGLTQSTVDARWTNLLEGNTYSYGGTTKRWRGLISQAAATVDAIEATNTITLIVDRGHTVLNGDTENDPIDEATSVQLPPSLVGKNIIVVQRAFGQLRTDEFSISGSTLNLLNGVKFAHLDTYFLKAATLTINTSSGLNNESLIANYVYYWYMRNNATQTTPGGENGSVMENAVSVSPAIKMQRASYELDRWASEMYEYLNVNSIIYPEWRYQRCRPLGANAFNL